MFLFVLSAVWVVSILIIFLNSVEAMIELMKSYLIERVFIIEYEVYLSLGFELQHAINNQSDISLWLRRKYETFLAPSEEFERATITGHFRIVFMVFENNTGRERNHVIIP